MMHGDSRVMVVVCLETASLPAPCLSTSTSPRSREEQTRGLQMGLFLSGGQRCCLTGQCQLIAGLPMGWHGA